MSQCSVLKLCTREYQRDLWWYYLCACAALGLRGLPIGGTFCDAEPELEPSPQLLRDAAKATRIQRALFREEVSAEDREILHHCYTVRGASPGEFEEWGIAAGYALRMQRDVDAGQRPKWLASALVRLEVQADWRHGWKALKGSVRKHRRETDEDGDAPDLGRLVIARVDDAHGAYLAGCRARRAMVAEERKWLSGRQETARMAMLAQHRGGLVEKRPKDAAWWMARALERLGLA